MTSHLQKVTHKPNGKWVLNRSSVFCQEDFKARYLRQAGTGKFVQAAKLNCVAIRIHSFSGYAPHFSMANRRGNFYFNNS